MVNQIFHAFSQGWNTFLKLKILSVNYTKFVKNHIISSKRAFSSKRDCFFSCCQFGSVFFKIILKILSIKITSKNIFEKCKILLVNFNMFFVILEGLETDSAKSSLGFLDDLSEGHLLFFLFFRNILPNQNFT